MKKVYLGQRGKPVDRKIVSSFSEYEKLLTKQRKKHGVKPLIYSISETYGQVHFKHVFGLEGHTLTKDTEGKGVNVIPTFHYDPRSKVYTVPADWFFDNMSERLCRRADRLIVMYGFLSRTDKINLGLYPHQIEKTERYEIEYLNDK